VVVVVVLVLLVMIVLAQPTGMMTGRSPRRRRSGTETTTPTM